MYDFFQMKREEIHQENQVISVQEKLCKRTHNWKQRKLKKSAPQVGNTNILSAQLGRV